jgi:STE24 endopeptidase
MIYRSFFLLLLALSLYVAPSKAKADDAVKLSPISSSASAPAIVTAYTLPPKTSKKATDLGEFHFRFAIFGLVYQLFLLWAFLRFRIAVTFRNRAEKASNRRWVQGLIFSAFFILSLGFLGLPADIYENSVARKYGLSIQSWSSWFSDWTKEQLLALIFGTVMIAILFWVIRRSPRRWWFYFWLASLPIMAAIVFLEPVVIDPLFHKFEPLQSKAPELTASLVQMAHKAGQDIPAERMFWMGAGEKTTTLNAYVSGFGASKRIVVWDTTLSKMNTPQIVFVAGHEMGHYVLGHIWKGLIFTAILLLGLFYFGFRSIGGLLQKLGTRWSIRGVDDWAALPALVLLFSVFMFLMTPLMNGLSRHIEHQADQYGLEITHGLQSDSAQKAAQAFQILGEVDLAETHPNPLNVFLFFSHPTINDRIHFALAYDPWSKAESPEFVQ